MAQPVTYKYCVLIASPNERRGERINIGAIVFCPDRLDVRIPEATKLGCISSGPWDTYLAVAATRLKSEFSPDEDPLRFRERFTEHDPVMRMSELGWFLADSDEAYEAQVSGVLSDLVLRPRAREEEQAETQAKKTGINREIAKEFSRIRILAKRKETIEDHLVTRDYYVSVTENLRADFAVKNGVFHITSTLDLRRESAHIKEACWKACVLMEAKRLMGDTTRRLGVYAAAYDATQFRAHIELLKEYSTKTYNWMNPEDQYAYKQAMISAVQRGAPGTGTLLGP